MNKARKMTAVFAATSALLGATFAAGTPDPDRTSAPTIDELRPRAEFAGDVEVSHAELAEWEAIISSPEERETVVAGLRKAFSGLAEVGTGADGKPEKNVQPSSIGDMELVLAYGANPTHVWITASYADMARGAVSAAVQYCKRYVPSWLCKTVGNQLSSWAQGWGRAANHGVWAAVYWAPPRFTGGRW